MLQQQKCHLLPELPVLFQMKSCFSDCSHTPKHIPIMKTTSVVQPGKKWTACVHSLSPAILPDTVVFHNHKAANDIVKRWQRADSSAGCLFWCTRGSTSVSRLKWGLEMWCHGWFFLFPQFPVTPHQLAASEGGVPIVSAKQWSEDNICWTFKACLLSERLTARKNKRLSVQPGPFPSQTYKKGIINPLKNIRRLKIKGFE